LAGTRLAAIGPATAAALHARGLRVDLQPGEFVAEKVLDTVLSAGPVAGKRFLLPRAADARDPLPQGLRNAGAHVETVAAYKTVAEVPDDRDALLNELSAGGVDAVTFTSSSTVRNFVSLLGPDEWRKVARGCVLASIGPITSDTLRECGAEPTVQAAEYTIPGLVHALVKHFTSKASDRAK
jgi:uroporphyrinogen III methyltransferase/synthase